jgi:hypothetical protein
MRQRRTPARRSHSYRQAFIHSKSLICHDIALYCRSSPLHYRKELIVKNPQLQGAIEGRDNPAGETAFESIPMRTSPRESADQPGYDDSLDIPLNYGIVMDAVRDAVRANQ